MKDDVELIEAGISHLRTIGFEHIVVCDRCSADGINEILDRYRSKDFNISRLAIIFRSKFGIIRKVVRRYSGERFCELRQLGDLNSARV